MLYDVVDDPASKTTAELQAAYERALADVIEAAGVADVAESTGVGESTLSALVDGNDAERPALSLEDAAAILALDDGTPDAEGILLELRDHLLMGMTTGVLDVDTLASELDIDLSGQEVQQSLEGRRRTTLSELAAIHRVIAARNDR